VIACGFGLGDSLFEFASAIGTVGLSVGVTSAGMPDVALWCETLAMFLGRLEFMVVIVSVLKLTGDLRVMLSRGPVKGPRAGRPRPNLASVSGHPPPTTDDCHDAPQ